MPNITPTQLPLLADPLNDNAIFIVQQDGVVAKVPFSALHAIVRGALEQYIVSRFQSTYAGVQNTISGLTDALSQKSPINHSHTPSQVGLSNVQNIAPENMPISIAVQEALDAKVDNDTFNIGEELIINGGAPPAW